MKIPTALGPLLFVLALLCSAPAAAVAQEQPETKANPDAKCVKCHSRGLKKKLEDGSTMSLKIDVDTFESSVHRVIGCTGCHRGHGRSHSPMLGASQKEVCLTCHGTAGEAEAQHTQHNPTNQHNTPPLNH